MIRYKLKERIADLEFSAGRVVTLGEIADATKLNRSTLSKIANQKGYNAGMDVIDRLCTYFSCKVEDLVEYIPN